MKSRIHNYQWLIIVMIMTGCTDTSFAQDCPVPDSAKRVQIHQLIQPFQIIAQLSVHRKLLGIVGYDDASTCSFVGKNVVVTAGHVFKHPGRVTEVTIYISKREENGKETWLFSQSYPIGRLKLFVNPVFQQNEDADFDYAYLAFNDNLSNSWFKLARFEDTAPQTDSLHITGYPGDKKNQQGARSQQLWTKGEKVGNILATETVLLYSIFTWPGDSGAPIWTKIGTDYFLVGIHGTGVYGKGHQNCNAGVKFTAERLTELQNFILANVVH